MDMSISGRYDAGITRLRETVARKQAESRQALAREAQSEDGPQRELLLEHWPEAVRGMPNGILRGALFSVSQERKHYKKRTLIAAVDGYEIRFKGEGFNQTDLDVLEALLHIARPHPLGKQVEFSVHSFLKGIGRNTSGMQHEMFKEQVARLIGGVAEITDTRLKKTFIGTLVSKAYRNEETGQYIVIFDKDMLSLYESGYSYVNWEQRLALGQNSLAKWLHGFYSTHSDPHPYKVETLYKLSGSNDKQLKSFRQKLKRAFEVLVGIGAISAWKIGSGDLVVVQKSASKNRRQAPRLKTQGSAAAQKQKRLAL